MLEKIKNCLDEAHSVALFGHENIDGDALWSILGFWALLEKQWKEVSYFTPHKPSHVFEFLNLIINLPLIATLLLDAYFSYFICLICIYF